MGKFSQMKVGDTVFVVDQLRRGMKHRPSETKTVIRIGRKYAYLDKYGSEAPFFIEDGKSAHKEYNTRANGYGFDVYISEDEYIQEQLNIESFDRLKERLIKYPGSLHVLPSNVVCEIHKILDAAGL